jgi:O-antigen ligase
MESILLVLVLAITALRASFIEVTYQSLPNPLLPLPAEVLSILISAVLIGAFFLWLTLRLLRPPADQIAGGLGLAVCVFLMTGTAAAFVASSKRDAVTDLVTLAAPLLVLLMLTDLFRKPQRILPALWLLLALGVTSVYQCNEQARTDNESVLQDYQKDPQRVLRQLGIEPGTLKQWQFEHRLRSKDVRGFLTTSNSTGSFLLLCLFACLGLFVQTLRQIKSSSQWAIAVLYALIALILAYGLYLCKSRGALVAGAMCLTGWLLCVLWGKKLWPYRYLLVLITIAAATGLLIFAVHYGLTHGRLPGPNALLVRWQYWQSTCRLIADRPLLGVGGGNFTIWYPLYKIPAAPEMVRDPHNFLLALASQYGLLGAATFTLVLIVPLLSVLKRDPANPSPAAGQVQPSIFLGVSILLAAAFVFLLLRPLVTEGTIAESNTSIRQAYYLVYYLTPAGVMILIFGLLFLAGGEPSDPVILNRSLPAALSWGAMAVLIHNLIDFALFETAVLMALMICLAAILALVCPAVPLSPRPLPIRVSAALLLIAALAGFLWIAVIPPVRAGARIQQALGQPDQAGALLTAAEQLDRLSPQAAWLNGQLVLQQFQEKIIKDPALLEQAAEAYSRAILRNPLDYRLHESLADVYMIRAESEQDLNEKIGFLKQSYVSARQAFVRFPGSDRLAFKLGLMAEQIHRIEEARLWYCLAVEIEEAYRIQFRQMYPGHDLFSRLGEERYQYALEFIRSAAAPDSPSPDNP